MTDVEHTQWEELVAGYALDALEPGDEADVRAHLASCEGCRAALAEHRETAGALADAVVPVPTVASARAALLDALDHEPAPPQPRLEPPVTSPPPASPAPARPAPAAPPPAAPVPGTPAQRGRDRLRAIPVAVALIAVTVAGVSVVVARQQGDARREQTDRARQVALCVRDSACQRVDLVGGGRSRGIALVRDGHVQLVVDALAANDETSRIYVLWQLVGGTARAVGSFDVRPGGTVTGAMPLPSPARGFTLAVTLERGRTPPDAPGSAPVAAGTVA